MIPRIDTVRASAWGERVQVEPETLTDYERIALAEIYCSNELPDLGDVYETVEGGLYEATQSLVRFGLVEEVQITPMESKFNLTRRGYQAAIRFEAHDGPDEWAIQLPCACDRKLYNPATKQTSHNGIHH